MISKIATSIGVISISQATNETKGPGVGAVMMGPAHEMRRSDRPSVSGNQMQAIGRRRYKRASKKSLGPPMMADGIRYAAATTSEAARLSTLRRLAHTNDWFVV